MLKFICKRLIISVFIILGIILILFALFQIQPGNPYLNFIKPGMSPEQIENMLIKKGYYDSIYVKFVKLLYSLIKFDFGYSLQYEKPVMKLISERLPMTLFITVPAFCSAMCLACLVGRRIAFYPKTVFARFIQFSSSLGICTPAFFIALFLIKIFAFELQLLPLSGTGDITKTGFAFFINRIYHSVLPILTLTLMQFSFLVRYVSGFMLSIKDEDFIRTYEGFGLTKYKAYKTAGFYAIIPNLITMTFTEIPFLISGALITETVFVWQGIGKLNFDAVQFRDYPLILGITAITASIVLIANLCSDILNYYFDKRMRL